MVETKGVTPQAAASQYWQQMKLLVNDQIDGILEGYSVIGSVPSVERHMPTPRPVSDSELDPPADPSTWTVPSVPATASLDAVVAATHDRQIDDQLSPDYAGGPEPVPAGWPSDDDVPF